ncbi:MAG: sigma-54-dependent Fis family transcriptional regulator, partial [Bdellovibrionaceae bacterium]|nr:sigma-54-dependent Fis family transcriptional regulator [Pseudobdellovibrionaceae bacterium]
MSELFNLLIAEDDATLVAALKLMIPDGFKIYVTQNPDLIPDHVFFHAALVDMHITSRVGEKPDGPEVIARLVSSNPQIEVVSMSGDLNRQNMEAAIKAGVQRFLSKPLSAEEITLVFEKILAYWQLRQFEFTPHQKINLLGSSPATENLRKTIANLRQEKSAVLIEGETGSGKEVVAHLLNQQEGKIPFVTVNCAAINENLFESEFFGHVKGAFTGADQNKVGLAEAAHGGDLFLDEIDALPLSQQAKLLRFLESGEIKKVGAKESIHVKTRIIAATNQSLQKLVEERKFREDLYFRLSSQKIAIAPLRNRHDDIENLTQYFVDKEKPRRNKTFSKEAIEVMKKYAWPGNVRELKRVCEQLVLTSPLPMIRPEDVEKIIAPSLPKTIAATDMNLNLADFINQQEKNYITLHLKNEKDLDKICHKLKISKS